MWLSLVTAATFLVATAPASMAGMSVVNAQGRHSADQGRPLSVVSGREALTE